MRYKKLGKTQMKVSVLSFGCSGFGNVFGDVSLHICKTLVKKAVENGINYFDTSPFYGALKSETVLGQCLSGFQRNQFYISTKCGRYGKTNENGLIESVFDYSPEKITQSIKGSLQRLQLDYFDIVYLHDIEFAENLEDLVRESLPALLELKSNGIIKNIGVSGFPLQTLDTFLELAANNVDVVLSYAHDTLQCDLLNAFVEKWKKMKVGIVNASPFAMGLFTNKGPPPWHPASKDLIIKAREASIFCAEKECDIASLALSHSLQNDSVDTVLTGINSMDELLVALDVEKTRDFNKDVLKGLQNILKGVHNEMW